MNPKWWLIPSGGAVVAVIGWLMWFQCQGPDIDQMGLTLALLALPSSWALLLVSWLTAVGFFICALIDMGWSSLPSRKEWSLRRQGRSTRVRGSGGGGRRR